MLRLSESLPAKMDHEFWVTRTKLGRYYISILVPLDVKHPIQQQQPDAVGGGDNQAPAVAPHAAAAIDLGVRTPFMVYSPDEARVYELGANDFGRIRRLCHHLDDLVSRTTDRDVRKKRRRRMRRAAARMRRRIRDLVDDLHRRAAKWLCETFETIIYLHYETSNMVVGKSKRRGLHSKTVRAMLTWSHFRFKQHLLHKIREYPLGCRVVLVDESYTSKTCGGCGRINHGLGKSKLFWCEQCGFRTDRDWNGARNIWLKFLTEWCNGSSRGNDDDDKEQQQQQQQ